MFYASIEIREQCPVFGVCGGGGDSDCPVICRGQEFHYSEVITEEESPVEDRQVPVLVTAERPGAKPKPGGYAYRNTFASYLHIFFASKCHGKGNQRRDDDTGSLADNFVRSAIHHSPR